MGLTCVRFTHGQIADTDGFAARLKAVLETAA
jgi:hypothetical protein